MRTGEDPIGGELTTTPAIEGLTIKEYTGNELIEARQKAMNEMAQRALSLGANAVVGIDIDYEVLGPDNGMLMVTASGTAVIID